MYFVCFKTISLDAFVFCVALWQIAFCDVLFSEHQIEADDAIAKEREQLLRVSCKVYGIRVPATSLVNSLDGT